MSPTGSQTLGQTGEGVPLEKGTRIVVLVAVPVLQVKGPAFVLLLKTRLVMTQGMDVGVTLLVHEDRLVTKVGRWFLVPRGFPHTIGPHVLHARLHQELGLKVPARAPEVP